MRIFALVLPFTAANLGAPCSEDTECRVNEVCYEEKCVCDEENGFYDNPGGVCLEKCTRDNDCTTTNTICDFNWCSCDDPYSMNDDGKCVVECQNTGAEDECPEFLPYCGSDLLCTREFCQSDSDCGEYANTICDTDINQCVCDEDFYDNGDDGYTHNGGCLPKCKNDDDCTDTYAFCSQDDDSIGECVCDDGYLDNDGVCEPEPISCESDDDCPANFPGCGENGECVRAYCVDDFGCADVPNTVCDTDTYQCVCKNGFDDNGEAWGYKENGGCLQKCRTNVDCIDEKATCSTTDGTQGVCQYNVIPCTILGADSVDCPSNFPYCRANDAQGEDEPDNICS